MSLGEKIFRHWLKLPYGLSVRYKRMSKPFKTTYVLIHGLADTGELWKPLLSKLPKNSNYIVVDLLGHGESGNPVGDDIYSAARQAQNVLATCLRAGLSGPVVLIGHSFGSLVASEFAHGYRGIVRQLILISPPIYRDETQDRASRFRQEEVLLSIYKQLLKQPDAIVKGYKLVDKLRLMGFSKVKLTQANLSSIASTLKSGIISQQAGKRLMKSTVPTVIIYGKFDPLLVPKNFNALKRKNSHISVRPLPTGHAIHKTTLDEVLKQLNI